MIQQQKEALESFSGEILLWLDEKMKKTMQSPRNENAQNVKDAMQQSMENSTFGNAKPGNESQSNDNDGKYK